MKRLFIGFLVEPSFIESRYIALRNEFENCLSGKWIDLNALHVTLKFIGNFDEERISLLQNALCEHLQEYRESFQLRGLSVFSSLGQPNVLYIKVSDSKSFLKQKATAIEKVCSDFGVPAAKREFVPHLTLARIKSVNSSFYELLHKHKNTLFSVVSFYTIAIFESLLTPEGAIYLKIN
ncbi:MAG: RNA 2',3'-cyclic phosphodiesterase [Cytophagales bacterium]|nr:RNA 2',3'-cyclic phosphodiesterase [Cytophagales bacterium]MDW8383850.1 RNA 2',3'-cyclic phosphodiesterase [Flammeovirgaceae bacterium]